MIITISGPSGSGKSTVAKLLVEKLKAARIYVGGVLRKLAQEKSMTIEELMTYAQTHPEIDKETDKKARDEARRLAKKGRNVVVEGRMQFFLLPESIKLFVTADPDERARRIWKDLQDAQARKARNEELTTSLQATKEKMERRDRGDAARYEKLYGVDYQNKKNYDLVVDTTTGMPEEAVQQILSFLKRKVTIPRKVP